MCHLTSMNRHWASLLLFALSCMWGLQNAQAASKGAGQALQPIVISTNASETLKSVASELGEYLQRITGATFEIQTGDGLRGIVLGNITDFPNPSLAKALTLRNTYDGREAYAIHSEGNRLWLIGGTDQGASHAAFAFLEKLGCRWIFPGKA